jgi:hypothetical protein
MQKLQLYIGTQRVDLFKDETVSLTQSIQNVKDISKIFTEFSKTFSLPASKVNNKIFRHYYNFDIEAGFDARNKVAGSIELNTLPFKEGFIKLEGVDLKNNMPHTYKITFFGNTINLVDVLGDDQLSTLSSLATYNTNYTDVLIKSGLTSNPSSNNICVPFISHTQRYYYDSGTPGTGNLYAQSTGSPNGLLWSDLKYAIRLQAIIDAIEAQTEYGLTFSNDFFNDSSNTSFHNLWMWLHRKKGSVEPTTQLSLNYVQAPSASDDWTEIGTGGFVSAIAGILTLGTLPSDEDGTLVYDITTLTLTPLDNASVYSVIVYRNGSEIAALSNVSGVQTMFNSSPTILGAGSYTVEIASIGGVTFPARTAGTNNAGLKWVIGYENITPGPGGGGGSEIFVNETQFDTSTIIQFAVAQQIPEMSIIDFLTGIFKMFNLTAYVDNTGTIVVRTLDSYYAAGSATPINIDKYLDVTKSTVDVALPFKEIKFAFKGLGTFLAKQYFQLNNQGWGTLKYTNESSFDGPNKVYNVEAPFEHVMYERLINPVTGNGTTLQYGFFVDDNQQSYYGLPLIFYAIYKTSGTPISFKTTSANETISNYVLPSNSLSFSGSTSKVNINFGAMVNEYDPNGNFTDTLFFVYYQNYIKDVFNIKSRLTKIKAMLPLKIFYNLQLNDKLQFQQNTYKINSITTNLTTGESDIELLNVVQ